MNHEKIKQIVADLRPGFWGRVLYCCIPIRRKVVLANMRIVFDDVLELKEIKKLAICFYTHLFRTFFENIRLSWMRTKNIKDQIRVEGIEHLMKAAEGNRGIILLTGHFGNWELAPMAGIQHFPQFKGRLHILRRQIVNKTVEKILFRRFYQMGLDVIPKRSSLSRVMGALSRNDTVAFIMDQFAKPGKEGIESEFFGRNAGTFKSLAMVARSSESPVLPAASWREDGRHVMKFFPPLLWLSHDDSDAEIRLNTDGYNKKIEEIILEHPDQWLWMHKRWKKKPAQRSAA